jgi:hypothetical protein
MAIDRSWRLTAAVGGVLLGLLSVFWLAKSVELIVDNAGCCLWTAEGDGRRSSLYATVVASFQVGTLAIAVRVVRQRGLWVALGLIVFYVAVTVVLMGAGGGGEIRLWLNLLVLVVAGLAIAAAVSAPATRPSAP